MSRVEHPWFHETFAAWHPDEPVYSGEVISRRYVIQGRTFSAWGYAFEGDLTPPRVEVRAQDGEIERAVVTLESQEDAIAFLVGLAEDAFVEPSSWADDRVREAAALAAKHERRTYFAKESPLWCDLAAAHVEKLTLNFSGSGDGGGLDDIEIDLASTAPDGYTTANVPPALLEKIEEALWERFTASFDNEGAEGDLTVVTSAKVADLSLGIRSLDWETTSWGEDMPEEAI